MEDLNGQGLTLLVVTHDRAVGERAGRQLKFRDGRLDRDSARK